MPRDTFFFDNNLSPALVDGLRGFGEDVQHLRDQFPVGTDDTVWIPEVAKRGWVLVSFDKKINRKPVEVDALVRSRLSALFFTQKRAPDGWGWIELVVRRWADMKTFAESERRPFVAGVPLRGGIRRIR